MGHRQGSALTASRKGPASERAKLEGKLEEESLQDLLDHLHEQRDSGVIRVRCDMGAATLWVREGELIDAQAGKLRGVNAVFRAMRFDKGTYVVEFGDPTRPVRIDAPLQSLIDEAARRAAQVVELVLKLPPFDERLGVNMRRTGPLDEEQRQLVELFRPQGTIDGALDQSEGGEVETLTLLEQLVGAGVLELIPEKPLFRSEERTVEIEIPKGIKFADDEETTAVKEIPRRPSPPPISDDEETTAVKEIPRRSEPHAPAVTPPPPPSTPPLPRPPKPRPVPQGKLHPAAPPPTPLPEPPLPKKPLPKELLPNPPLPKQLPREAKPVPAPKQPPKQPLSKQPLSTQPVPKQPVAKPLLPELEPMRPAPLPPIMTAPSPDPLLGFESLQRIAPQPPSSTPPPRRRVLGVLVFVGAATLGGLGYLYFAMWQEGDAQQPTVEAASTKRAAPPAPSAAAGGCPDGMVFVRDGRYFMGSDSKHETLRASVPAHQVVVEALCIDRHEVTASQYEKCVSDGACTRVASKVEWPKRRTDTMQAHQRTLTLYAEHCNAGKPGRKNHPMNCLTASEAEAYCQHAGARLPHEAEWEFAARGSDGRVYPWGDDAPSARLANGCGGDCKRWHDHVNLDTPEDATLYQDDDGYAGTSPVGSFSEGATRYGALDMIGNVAEWTADPLTPYAGANAKLDSEPNARVVRGGSFLTVGPEEADAAARQGTPPTVRSPAIGFRCVASPRP